MGVTAINGRSGRVAQGGVAWNFDDCKVKVSVETGKTTGFEDQQANGQTAENRTSGNQDITGTISGPLNAAQMPGGTWVPGALLTNLYIYLDKAVPVTRYVGSTLIIIKSVDYGPKQSDPAQRITIEFENAGGLIGNTPT